MNEPCVSCGKNPDRPQHEHPRYPVGDSTVPLCMACWEVKTLRPYGPPPMEIHAKAVRR